MPCIGSTTTPSTRRSWPHTRSTSSASCRPSTQIRAARAVRARWPSTRTDPDADRAGAAGARLGTTRVAGAPSNRNPAGRNGNTRLPPWRSSRVTPRASTPTTAPQNPLAGSSTTSPGSATTSGICLRVRMRVPSAANAPR
jgi:hypothetical protein